MRRLFIYLIVAMLAFGALKAMRHHPTRHAPPAQWRNGPHPQGGASRHELATEAHRKAQQAVVEARRAMQEAGHEVRQAWREARDEMGRAYQEARDEIRQAYHEMLADNDGRRPPLPTPPPPPTLSVVTTEREEADGLPVPIVPGTRVTEAQARPPAPPVPPRPPAPARLASQARPPVPDAPACENPEGSCVPRVEAKAEGYRAIPGDLCATEDRARADARRVLQAKVGEWLAPDVPASWIPPAALLQAMVVETKIDPRVSQRGQEYGPTYVATLTADFSPRRRAELVDAYSRELVKHRLVTLGGSLGFVLICLAAVSGYIRADEATKGYYTNRLRMLAAAGVGAAGVIVYKMVA